MRTVLLLAVAACGGSPPPPTHDTTLSSRAADVIPERATPAPKVVFADNAFITDTLPAVARASEITVVPIRDNDGGRGYPNLKLEVHDRNDKLLQTIQVMTSNEYETLALDGKASPALVQRIDAANQELQKLHGVHDLVPMHPLDMQRPKDGSEQHMAMGDDLDVDWDKDHLHVFHHNTDHPIAIVDGKPWLAKQHTPVQGLTCENPAFLKAVYHAQGINVVVVQIAYHGTDTCWEPGDQLHAITF
jgi:hypothetical protein